MKTSIGIHSAFSNQRSSTAASGRRGGGGRSGHGGRGNKGSQSNNVYVSHINVKEDADEEMDISDKNRKF
jgi:hypothetical protein